MGTSEGGTYKSSRILHARTSIFAQICARRPLLLDKHTIKSSTIGIQYSLRPASDLTNCEVARRYGLNLLVANLRVLSSTSPGRRSFEKKVTNSQIVQLYI